MANIVRRSIRASIPAGVVLAVANDLDGYSASQALGTGWLDVTEAQRCLIAQVNDGTAGTVGVDVIQISHDDGLTWAADDTLLLASAADANGAIVTDAALNAAGAEPTGAAFFKSGPYEGPTYMRVNRDTSDAQAGAGIDWVTGAPSVSVFLVK